MEHMTSVEWKEGLAFDVDIDGHSSTVDADREFGGKDLGPKPKALLLAGLAGCTGMDVASVLSKMNLSWDSFRIDIGAETADSHPQVYTKIHIKYILTGASLDRSKVERAVNLSMDKYCAVSAMLRKTAEITNEIILNS